jgi:hypothetical protein
MDRILVVLCRGNVCTVHYELHDRIRISQVIYMCHTTLLNMLDVTGSSVHIDERMQEVAHNSLTRFHVLFNV